MNRDVLDIIFEYLNECAVLGSMVTLVSRRTRNRYFLQNGIWIHLFSFIKQRVDFPEHFYRYKINLNFKIKDEPEARDYSEFIEKIREHLDLIDKNLGTHVINNTCHIKNSGFDLLPFFPNLKKVSKVEIYHDNFVFDFLVQKGISGYTMKFYMINFTAYVMDKFLRTPNWLYLVTEEKIESPVLINKIVKSGIEAILPDTFYPNLEAIYIRSRMPDTKYKRTNFPKLKTINLSDTADLAVLSESFPANIEIIWGRKSDEGILKSILMYGYRVKLYNFVQKDTAYKYSRETHNSTLLRSTNQIKNIQNAREIVSIVKNKGGSLIYHYNSIHDAEIIEILSDKFLVVVYFSDTLEKVIKGFVKKLQNYTGEKKRIKVMIKEEDKMCYCQNLFIKLYSKTGLFLDMGQNWDTSYNREYYEIKRSFRLLDFSGSE